MPFFELGHLEKIFHGCSRGFAMYLASNAKVLKITVVRLIDFSLLDGKNRHFGPILVFLTIFAV